MSESAVGGPVSGAPGDASAPLQLIRERETELSRRVLAARREADEIIAEARRQAASILEEATEESAAEALEHLRLLDIKAEAEAREIIADAELQASTLSDTMGSRLQEAVDHITESVIAG